jgi:putative nucleotidyltransferase with HDIG domain
MPLFTKRTARQKEIRRSRTERKMTWYHRLVGGLRAQPLVLLLLGGLVGALGVTIGRDPLALRVGEHIDRAAAARVSFRVFNKERTSFLRSNARDNAPDFYTLDTSLLEDINGRLVNALRVAREHAGQSDALREQTRALKIQLDDAGLAELQRLADQPEATGYQQAVDRALRALRSQYLVRPAEPGARRTGTRVVLVDPSQAVQRQVSVNELIFSNDPESVTQAAQAAAAEFPAPLRDSIRGSLMLMLRGEGDVPFKPLYRYDTKFSVRAAQEAEDAVPAQYDEYPQGTRLADPGPLSRDQLRLLQLEHEHFLAFQAANPAQARQRTLTAWARGLATFLLIFFLGGYIIIVGRDQVGDTRRRTASAITLMVALLAARAIYLQTPIIHLTVGVYALAIALLAITSPRGPAYAAGGLLAILITLATRQSTGFLVILVPVAIVLYLGLRDVRHRGRIIAVGGFAAAVAGVLTVLIGIVNGQALGFALWHQATWALLTTLAAAFIVEGILPGIERLFGVTTAMTLLEWCDPNKPLLRMLAAESPGTYNHSLLVGTLADAAADAIGANGLLARTGAYYHDIGKINKPEYFVENQALDVGNRHERLSPAMSHLIIIGHVKDGIEMAKEYGLPASLHPFIPEHHGTCVVEYFYHAANRARKPGDPQVSDTQFRYPGPKPRSRETAIVMLCDGVEGAVRAMSEPTPNRIEDTVDRIIQKRMMDGQFDECDLTFRQLAAIRDSLVKSLSAIYHGRITYPSSEKTPETRTAS